MEETIKSTLYAHGGEDLLSISVDGGELSFTIKEAKNGGDACIIFDKETSLKVLSTVAAAYVELFEPEPGV